MSAAPTPLTTGAVPCGACDQSLSLRLTTDSYGQEVTWQLQPGGLAYGCAVNDTVIGGPYAAITGGQETTEVITPTLCVGQSYIFTLFDSFGDGMLDGAVGSFALLLGAHGRQVASGDGNYTSSTSASFVVTVMPPSPAPTVPPTAAPFPAPSSEPTARPFPAPTHVPVPAPTPLPSSKPILPPTPVPSAVPTIGCGPCSQSLVLDLKTDNYGEEVTWDLVSTGRAGNCAMDVVASGGPYPNLEPSGYRETATIATTICAHESYRFTLRDSFGDGMLEWGGKYALILSGGVVARGDGNYTWNTTADFVAPIAPTPAPTLAPTAEPTPRPSGRPTPEPTPRPSGPPTPEPTALPTTRPLPAPTGLPTPEPTARPIASPTPEPSTSCGACDQTLVLNLLTDSYGPEVTWQLSTGSAVAGCAFDSAATGGPYPNHPEGNAVQVTALQGNFC